LSQAPDLTKTSLCAAFMGGHCPLPSGECHYAHGEEELRITPEFINKKLSRRTRDAVVSDTSATSQEGDPEVVEAKLDWTGLESNAPSEAESTDPPNSPQRWASSGVSTPVSTASPAIASMLPALSQGIRSRASICLADVVDSPRGADLAAPTACSRPSRQSLPGGSLPPPASAWPTSGRGPGPSARDSAETPPPPCTLSIAGAGLAAGDCGWPPMLLEPVRVVVAESLGLGVLSDSPSVDPIVLAARWSRLPLRVDI